MISATKFARLEYSEIDDKVYLVTKMFEDGWSSSTPLTEGMWVDLKELFEVFGCVKFGSLKRAIGEQSAD